MNLPNLESAFTLIWQISLRACVLIVVVLIAQALVRLPARFRYALGLLVLLRLLVPVTPASSWSIFNLTRHARLAPSAAPIIPSTVPLTVGDATHAVQPPGAISQPSRLTLGQWAAVFWLCGGAGFLLAVFLRHRKFARWVAQLPTATSPRLIELVGQCKSEAGVRRAVRITNAPAGSTAAVFRFLRPHLLLPEGMMDSLDGREVRLVLLHELFHIRRRDVFVNWISVLALALHWFNPLAWVALRRLRADQELACDAEVLSLIKPSERGAYGRTLLKHLHDFPAARMAAGLVPLITSRHNIKRRIIMITEFKNTGGLARGLFALLIVALGGLTFTRAADDPQPAATATSLSATPSVIINIPKSGPFYFKTKNGPFYVRSDPIPFDKLQQSLNEASSANPNMTMTISADTDTPWAKIFKVRDAANAAKIKTVIISFDAGLWPTAGATPIHGNAAIATSGVAHSSTPSPSTMTPFPDTSIVTTTNAMDAFVDAQIQITIRETYHGDRSFLIESLHEKGVTYEAWRRGQREYWIGQLKKDLFSK